MNSEKSKKDKKNHKVREPSANMNRNTLLGLVIATFLMCSAFGVPYFFTNYFTGSNEQKSDDKLITHAKLSEPPELENKQPQPPEQTTTEPVDEPKEPTEIALPQPAPPEPKPEETVEFTEPEVNPNPDMVEADIPSQAEMQQSGTQVASDNASSSSNGSASTSTRSGSQQGSSNNAQNEADEVFEVVEQKPQFPGGQQALMQYLSANINYPKRAREQGVDGRVIVQFIVKKDGSISQIKVVKGLGSGLDEEAIRLVESMPNWQPGVQGGSKVNVQHTLPIKFDLGL
jgi:TonB family protein